MNNVRLTKDALSMPTEGLTLLCRLHGHLDAQAGIAERLDGKADHMAAYLRELHREVGAFLWEEVAQECVGCGDTTGWYTSWAGGFAHGMPCEHCNPEGAPPIRAEQVAA